MTVVQIAKLAEWLQMHGHTAEEVLECIRYLAGREENERELAHPTKND